MKFCKYCGSQIENDVLICPNCSRQLAAPAAPAPQPKQPSNVPASQLLGRVAEWVKKPIVWIAVVALAAVAVLLMMGDGKCDYGSCGNKAASGSDYCYSHKCAISSCKESSYVYSNYCYSHHLVYDDDAAFNSSYVPSYQLKISNVDVYSTGNYTYAEGTITNNSDTTVTYVKIKGSFETSSGTVVDTDWTYAVGSEGLAPGESCKWRMSVTKDSSIRDCEISILDYDYD